MLLQDVRVATGDQQHAENRNNGHNLERFKWMYRWLLATSNVLEIETWDTTLNVLAGCTGNCCHQQ